MAIDAQQAALLVRVTARVSAAIVAADLVTAARRAARPGSAALRTADMATFVAFLASHTVHFVCVLLLAAAPGGENIRNSGGWVLVVMAALMFYGGAGMVVRVKLRRLAQPRERRVELACSSSSGWCFFRPTRF